MWRRRFVAITTCGRLCVCVCVCVLLVSTCAFGKEADSIRSILHLLPSCLHRAVDLRRSFGLLHGHECDALTDWPSDRPVGCRFQLEADERTMYLVADTLTAATRWHELFQLLKRYATNPYVAELLGLPGSSGASSTVTSATPTAGAAVLRMSPLPPVAGSPTPGQGKRMVPCSVGGFLQRTLLIMHNF